MNKKIIRKDFFMEIRRSLGRFLSIFFIVAIGVAFFSGIRSSEPDMRISGDSYFDKQKLMDIKVVSTLGLTDDDVDALLKLKGVEEVEHGYSVDALCIVHDSKTAVHIMSLQDTMNKVVLEDGRMPKNNTECVADASFLEESGYKIGDSITFTSGNDNNLNESLVNKTFRITGAVSSPQYISFSRGNTNIGTGHVAGFVCVNEDAFDMDVYTELYVRVKDAKAATEFTKAYDNIIDDATTQIEGIKEERQTARHNEIVKEATDKLNDAKQELEDGKKEAEEELSKALLELEDGQKKIDDGHQKIKDGESEIASNKNNLLSKRKEIENGLYELSNKEKEINNAQAALEDGKAQYEAGRSQLDSGKAEFDENKAVFEQKKSEYEAGKAKYDELQLQYDNLVASGADDPETLAVIEQLKTVLEGMKPTLDEAQAAIAAGQEELSKAEEMLTENEAKLIETKNVLDKNESDLIYGRNQIKTARAQLQEGSTAVENGLITISDKEKEIATSKEDLVKAQKDLDEGKAEYDKAKEDADKEIAEGEQKIKDAEEEIEKIEMAKWFIDDRSDLPEHATYGENADRMKAIGKVFPVLFFLVAALISLTTMTRMVEDERVQIGTLKALGYSRRTIAGKYLGYAALATLGGSVVGILIGEKVLPFIIIYAYGIMFPYVNEIIIPYNMYYGLMAGAAAFGCTMFATYFSCNKEMKEQAAQLMRPPSPKQGKRVFMERITFIWKHLSFIWKATVRNLIRYKKRFFMTVFGIGGCMALLLVGFGLEDSISNIAVLQFHEIQSYDASVILESDISAEEKANIQEVLDSDNRVDKSIDTLLKSVTLKNKDLKREAYLNVPSDVNKFKKFVSFKDRITKDTYKFDDDGVILTEKTAEMLDVKAGDTIKIKDETKGDIDVKVSAVCENYLGHFMYMTPGLYNKLYGQEPEYNSIYYSMKDDKKDYMEEVGENVLKNDGALSISYTGSLKNQIDNMLGSLDIVIVVLVISAGMLAFVVLYNLNNINITERQRELATLKVLGFYDKEVAAYVYRENIILSIIGALFGCILGRFLHGFVIKTVEIESAMFGRNIDFSSFVYGFLITMGFSLFVNLVMYFKLKKIDMVESLKSVE